MGLAAAEQVHVNVDGEHSVSKVGPHVELFVAHEVPREEEKAFR